VEYLVLIACLTVLWIGWNSNRNTLTLAHFEVVPDSDLPGLSVVIAARDEERVVRRALESLLELDYPDLEVVFVDDRSSDRTQEFASELARQHPAGHRLKVLTVQELPPDWLGKINALHLGVQATTKPLILLTDADVVFSPESLKLAASAQKVLKADHLVVAPQILARGFWEPSLVAFFLIMFAVRFRPNRVHRDKKRFVGIGAFNMLTREAMERCESLRPLRLQVLDDVHLGRLVKSRGMTQYCVVANEHVRVRWIEGLRGCVQGLEKNAYAGLNYSWTFCLQCAPIVCAPFWFPLTLALTGHLGWALLYLLFCFLLGLIIPKECHLPRWIGLTFPLASVVLVFTFLRSAWLAERRQGVDWRGTRYPLAQLRAAHREFIDKVAPL
jgi:cellulose synthase/poly-beta-1,6-N-acetylglucosamine synthase-like glycosyltransferase